MKQAIQLLMMLSLVTASCDSARRSSGNGSDPAALNGNWELRFISGPRIAFEGLYPEAKPSISFNVAEGTVSGNTSCNAFNTKLNATGNKIGFTDPIGMSRKFCEGQGEPTFIDMLKKVDSWSVTDRNTLSLMMGEVVMMRFERVK